MDQNGAAAVTTPTGEDGSPPSLCSKCGVNPRRRPGDECLECFRASQKTRRGPLQNSRTSRCRKCGARRERVQGARDGFSGLRLTLSRSAIPFETARRWQIMRTLRATIEELDAEVLRLRAELTEAEGTAGW